MGNLFSSDMSGNTATSTDSATITGNIVGNAMADSHASSSASNVITFEVDIHDVRAQELDICQANTAYQVTNAKFDSDINNQVSMSQNFSATVSQIADALAKNAASGDAASSSTDLSYYVSQVQNIQSKALQNCEASNRQTFIISASELSGNHVSVSQENVAISALASSCIGNITSSTSGAQSASLDLKQKSEAKAIGAMFTGIMGTIEMAVLGVVVVVLGILMLMVLFTISATGVMILFIIGYCILGYLIYSKVNGASFLSQDRAQTIADSQKNKHEYANAPVVIQGPFCFARSWTKDPTDMDGYTHIDQEDNVKASEAMKKFEQYRAQDPECVGALWRREQQYGNDRLSYTSKGVVTNDDIANFRVAQLYGPDGDGTGTLHYYHRTPQGDMSLSDYRKLYAYWDNSEPGVVPVRGSAGKLMTAGNDPTAPDGILKSRLHDLDGANDGAQSFTVRPFPMSAEINHHNSEQSTVFVATANGKIPLSGGPSAPNSEASRKVDELTLPWTTNEGQSADVAFKGYMSSISGLDDTAKQSMLANYRQEDADRTTALSEVSAKLVLASELREFYYAPYADQGQGAENTVTGIPAWLLGSQAMSSDYGPAKFIEFANTAMFFATPDRRSMLPVGTNPSDVDSYSDRMEMRIEKNKDGAFLCIAAYCGLLVINAVLLWNSISITTGGVLVAAAFGAAALYRMTSKKIGQLS